MNTSTQSKTGISATLKARKTHLNGLINLIQPKTGKTTQIENLTIAANNAEMGVIALHVKKRD